MTQIEDQQFTCPECGSHHFGSGIEVYGPVDPRCTYCHGTGELARFNHETCSCRLQGAAWSGACHGVIQEQPGVASRSCRFTWNRKDDALYFRGLGTFRPRTSTGVAATASARKN